MSESSISSRSVIKGFAAALIVSAFLVALVGTRSVIESLARADLWMATGALGAAVLWLVVWGLLLRVALRMLHVNVTPGRTVLIYTSATFLNGLTPFAQVGGEVLSAAVIKRATGATYDDGLAAVMAVDLINLVPSPLIAFVGFASLVAAGERAPEFHLASLTILGVSIAAAAMGVLVWRFRTAIGRVLTRIGVGAVAVANRLTGRVMQVDGARLTKRIESFFARIGEVTSNRHRLLIELGLSTVGWACLVLAFWLSVHAVGSPTPLGLVAFVLPVGMLAIAVVPLPGGVGGIEAALVGLLVAIGEVPVATATAGVILYRGVTYWMPLLVGGAITVMLTVGPEGVVDTR